MKLANWIKETVDSAPGTGTIDLGGAESNAFISFEDSDLASGSVIFYDALDGDDRELGIGTLTSGTPWTITRTLPLATLVAGILDTSSPTAIDLSALAIISINFSSESFLHSANLPNVQTGTTYTLQASDNGKTVIFTNAAAITVTVADTLFLDFQCTILQAGAGLVSLARAGTDTINGAATNVDLSGQWKGSYLTQFAAGEWVAVV